MSNKQSIKSFLKPLAKMRGSIVGLSLIVSLLLLIHPSSGTFKYSSKVVKWTGGNGAIKSERVKLRVPRIAENGDIGICRIERIVPFNRPLLIFSSSFLVLLGGP
ncbi:MAG: hypothetical protein IEMM0008_1118 [bacterium]|nr:MAG: hypothetical protein IEMM0008_1118 [bacterium]